MAVFKCKMCGGDLEIATGVTVAECEYCGTKQTLPKANDEVVQNLFNRANILRIKCEFDKAEQIYEKILQENDAEAEAHWGIVLCKYGIEYVEDPKTYKRIPTCHRTSYDAVTADTDYLAAIANADTVQRSIYEAEAKAIDAIQKDILNIVKNEKPFDVFLCYKETDENGKRTQESVIANDIYHQLTLEGLKVFYAAITLEDKLGQEYEPYIFAAINSAKVMLVIGTQSHHFTSVWVKNEWSRFMKLMKTDRSKLLIPCYKDMDAYELPEEFAHLQAQDMAKIGFINDVVRGIKKITVKDKPQPMAVKETVVTAGNSNTAPLLERAFMFLEDGDWERADEFCEQILNIDPKNTQAYLGKLMAELRCKTQENLKDCPKPFDSSNHYQKVVRFADEKLKAALVGYIEHINNRNENARLEGLYNQAKKAMDKAHTESAYKEAAQLFKSAGEYLDSAELANKCINKAEATRKEALYKEANVKISAGKATGNISSFQNAIELLSQIKDYRNSSDLIGQCEELIKETTKRAARNKKITSIAVLGICTVIAIILLFTAVIIPGSKYRKAQALMDAGKYSEAIAAFVELGGYKDSVTKIAECKYNDAVKLLKAGKHAEAMLAFGGLGNYSDAKEQATYLWEKMAVRKTIAAGSSHTVGLKADGTVVAVGYNGKGQCDVSDWTNIVAIAAEFNYTVGLKADGTVVAVGANDHGKGNVSGWTDIVAIAAGSAHTVGLKADGTVVAVGDNGKGQCDVSDWTNIVAIAAGTLHTVGLKADGTVVAVGDNDYGKCNVSGWTDIVAITAGFYHTVGLKADGTVVVVGSNGSGQCDVSGWTDIVAIAADISHTIGLKADGTVVAVGGNINGQCDVSGWTDIVAIAASDFHTVGLKADGTVVAVGGNGKGQCEVSDWTNIKVPKK